MNMNEILAKASSIVESVENVYIGSVDANDFPNIKGMQVRNRDGLKTMYFSTEASTLRVAQYQQNSCACIYFNDNKAYKGVMLVGTMEVLSDAASRELVWRESDTMYYPKGVTDPNYFVLKFTAHSGRMYNQFVSTDFILE